MDSRTPRKGYMKVITKKEALAGKLCQRCSKFLNTRKVVKEPAVYIGSGVACKKCKLQIDLMDDRITRIWKIF